MTLHWGIAFPQCCKFIKVSSIVEEVDLEEEVIDDDELVMTVLLWAKVHSARQIPVITQIGQI